MASRTPRIVAVLVVVAVGGAAWYRFRASPETPAGPATGPAVGSVAPPDWSPETPAPGNGGAAGGGRAAGAQQAAAEPPRIEEPRPIEGTEVAQGQQVSVVVPWRRESPSKRNYEISDLTVHRDRETGALTWSRLTYRVALEAMDGDGSGAGRLRLILESFGVDGVHPATGLAYAFDSRSPESGLLDDPVLGSSLAPPMTIRNLPLEFKLDATGAVVDLDGVDQWHERWVAEVQRMKKGAVGEVPDAPTRESETERWSEYLFPPLGGGTVVGGTPRPWTRTQTNLPPPWGIVWTGKLSALRDDPDAFWVEIEASPSAERVSSRSSEAGASVENVKALLQGRGYVAQYRFGRDPGALLEARIDVRMGFATSRRSGGGPGQTAYVATWAEVRRAVEVRRTSAQ